MSRDIKLLNHLFTSQFKHCLDVNLWYNIVNLQCDFLDFANRIIAFSMNNKKQHYVYSIPPFSGVLSLFRCACGFFWVIHVWFYVKRKCFVCVLFCLRYVHVYNVLHGFCVQDWFCAVSSLAIFRCLQKNNLTSHLVLPEECVCLTSR